MAKIHYLKSQKSIDVLVVAACMMGVEFLKGRHPDVYEKIKNKDLSETHIFLKELPFNDLNTIFQTMQGEIWSPNGEARELILSLGLNHTSMSIGDIVETNSNLYYCDTDGWVKL